jgi:anthranilate phosphoribosyltransferase
MPHSNVPIADYLRVIGRGKDGARSLSRPQAQDMMSRLLAGQISDLEKGGFALAMRIKGESLDELAGFTAAVQASLSEVASELADLDAGTVVVLPSYNGARKLPNLTPLLALLLAQEGVPVLVHGITDDAQRTTSAQVFAALGLPAVHTAADVAGRWAKRLPGFMPLRTLHPALADLLALRSVLGVRNSGHTLAKLLQPTPGALRVVNHTHPEYATSLGGFLAQSGATALLLRGTEGEPVADARRLPALRCFVGGALQAELSTDVQPGPLASLPDLPSAIDAGATACAIQAILSGAMPVPAPITRQLQCLLQLRRLSH